MPATAALQGICSAPSVLNEQATVTFITPLCGMTGRLSTTYFYEEFPFRLMHTSHLHIWLCRGSMIHI
jgi:hypothetical protein